MTDHQPPPSGETLLTARDVADRLRVTPKTVLRLCRAGDLASIRVGRQYRIRPQAVANYLRANAQHPPRAAR